MGMLLDVAPELRHLFPAPDGFPTCGDLEDSPELEAHVQSTRASWAALSNGEL